MHEGLLVGYCRTSNIGQTLSIDVQRMAIESYAGRNGFVVRSWYVDRGPASTDLRRLGPKQPQLQRALDYARRERATLVVSRLDRLTRSTAVLAWILDDGPALLVVETPTATRFVLQIYAAVAEEYHRQVGKRIKAGAAVARAKGTKINPHGKRVGRLSREKAKAYGAQMRPIIEEIRRGRPMPGWRVADELNARGYRTITERLWNRGNLRIAWKWFHREWKSSRFPKGVASGSPRLVAAARAREEMLRPLIAAYRREGAVTASEIADCLNRDGVTLVGGGAWGQSTAHRLLRRLQGHDR